MGQKKKKLIAITAIHGALLAVVAVSVFPILWMCLISVKSTSESLTGFHSLWVSDPTLDNFKRLFQMIPVAQNTFNSVFTTLVGTVSSLFFCALAGFAFAKYRFPGRNLLFYSVIATMLVPPEVGAVPLFKSDQQPLVPDHSKNRHRGGNLLHESVYFRRPGRTGGGGQNRRLWGFQNIYQGDSARNQARDGFLGLRHPDCQME